jgi:thioredoxin
MCIHIYIEYKILFLRYNLFYNLFINLFKEEFKMVKTLNLTNFQESVAETEVALVKFWAPWCGPCNTYAPTFDKFAEGNKNVVCFSVDCEEFPELAQEFDVMSIPATLLFKNGEYTKTRSGKLTAEQLETLAAS